MRLRNRLLDPILPVRPSGKVEECESKICFCPSGQGSSNPNIDARSVSACKGCAKFHKGLDTNVSVAQAVERGRLKALATTS